MGILKFFGLQRIKDAKESIHTPSYIVGKGFNQQSMKYESDLSRGVQLLKDFGAVVVFDDGRGYELALDIKKAFIFDYTQKMAKSIKITKKLSGTREDSFRKITISTIPDFNG